MTATPTCGSLSQPKELTLTNVQPALGSSVPNVAIVQTFTISGMLLRVDPTFALPAAHTAGSSTPATVHWTYAPTGTDTVYTSEALTWSTAPGHVELQPPGLLVTSDGCVSTLPTPTFSYDITAP